MWKLTRYATLLASPVPHGLLPTSMLLPNHAPLDVLLGALHQLLSTSGEGLLCSSALLELEILPLMSFYKHELE